MQLVNLQGITLSYGQPPLLDAVDLSIYSGERACLIGRNGAGKSTLLKILGGQVNVDEGFFKVSSGVKIAQLEQCVPENVEGSVFEVISEGLGAQGALIKRFHQLIQAVATDTSQQLLNELESCQTELERVDGWDINQRVEAIITKMELDADAQLSSLSGGYKRRVLLARALVCQPDLLLLDEPTNHLDIESIQWLEQFLKKWDGALLFVSHDRSFMEALATRFIEIDRGQLAEFACTYSEYLQRKRDMQETEDRHNALFDKRLSQEEYWIRQGIKARRTRNEGRVRALEAMRRDYADRRVQLGTAKMDIQQAEKSGKIVAEARAINFRYGEEQIVREFSTLIQRGEKIGLIGRNGVGKTTVLKLLLGQLQPQTGHIKTGTNLNIAYFDQYRTVLDSHKSVQDNLSGGRDMLEIGDKSRHVISYLQDFLFAPERCRQPVSVLSGGERNRLLLAKLFLQPANVLVLDEPTNDLDIDTLDLLEELLIDYKGTILLVSHDRSFLNNVVTSTLVFEGDGKINAYVGGYDDWLRQRQTPRVAPKTAIVVTPKSSSPAVAKLSYRDQRELDALPAEIENLELQIAGLSEQLCDPQYHSHNRTQGEQLGGELKRAQQALDVCYSRWEVLDQS
jgi:ATP-binding cassette subfamily F protein uup